MAWTLGFAVTVVDVRERVTCTPDRFPGATLVLRAFRQFADRVTLRPGAFVAGDEPPRRARPGERCGSASNRMPPTSACSGRARASRRCWPDLAARGLRARRAEARARAQPGGACRWAPRRRTKWPCRSWRRSWRSGAASRADSSAARPRSLHRPDGHAGLGALVVLGRVDVQQQVGREVQDHHPRRRGAAARTARRAGARPAPGRAPARTGAAAP